jgi:hypothetical protein
MKCRTIEAANEFLAKWDGADVEFNGFTPSHQRFILSVTPVPIGLPFGISFPTCLYLSGPTSWSNARLRCVEVIVDGYPCYETSDKAADFVVRSGSIVGISDEGPVYGSE